MPRRKTRATGPICSTIVALWKTAVTLRSAAAKVVTQNDRLNADFLKALVPIREGQLYESDKIEQAVDALTFAAGSAGYAFVEINPTYKANPETDTVDVTFNVSEGQRVYIDRVNVKGNNRTVDKVIRREMVLAEGDPFNTSKIKR